MTLRRRPLRKSSLPTENGSHSKLGMRCERGFLRAITRHEHSRAAINYARAFYIIAGSLSRAFTTITVSLVVTFTAWHRFHPVGLGTLLHTLAALVYR